MIAPRQIAFNSIIASNSCIILNNLAHLGQWDPLYLEYLSVPSVTPSLHSGQGLIQKFYKGGARGHQDSKYCSLDPLASVSNYLIM